MNASSGRAPRAGRAPGRGRSQYGRGGQGNSRDTRRPRESAVSITKKFTRATKDMNGHVSQGLGEISNQRQYSKSIEELEAYVTKYMDFM